MSKPEILAIIPARGGSKGIPRKNIRSFAGFPLIAFSIAAAKKARDVSRIVVSTEDAEIAEISRHFGAEVPFLRPGNLAADNTPDLPVFQHALAWLSDNEDYAPELVMHLHATSPIRPINCLDQGIELMVSHPEVDCVRSVVTPKQNPYKMWKITKTGGYMKPLVVLDGVHEPYNIPRQSLPETYLQTGHTNVIRRKTILNGSMTGRVILPLAIDASYEIDMDTLEDWQYGEWVASHRELDMIWPEEIQ